MKKKEKKTKKMWNRQEEKTTLEKISKWKWWLLHTWYCWHRWENRWTERKKVQSKRKKKSEMGDFPNICMFLGIHVNKKCIEKLTIFQIFWLQKPITTSFLLSGALRMGRTVTEKTSMPCENLEDYNNFTHKKQMKYDGEDIVFIVCLIEGYGLFW